MLLPYRVLEKTHAQADGPAQLNGQVSTCLGMGRAVSKAELGGEKPPIGLLCWVQYASPHARRSFQVYSL